MKGRSATFEPRVKIVCISFIDILGLDPLETTRSYQLSDPVKNLRSPRFLSRAHLESLQPTWRTSLLGSRTSRSSGRSPPKSRQQDAQNCELVNAVPFNMHETQTRPQPRLEGIVVLRVHRVCLQGVRKGEKPHPSP